MNNFRQKPADRILWLEAMLIAESRRAKAAEASLLALQQQMGEKDAHLDLVRDTANGWQANYAEKDAELLALRAAHAQLQEQRETLRLAAIALADRVDQTSECDHHRIACEEIGCIGVEVKAVRRAALAASPPHPETQE